MKQLVDLKLGNKRYNGITLQKLSFLLDENARKFGSSLDRKLFEVQTAMSLTMLNDNGVIAMPAFKYTAEVRIHK